MKGMRKFTMLIAAAVLGSSITIGLTEIIQKDQVVMMKNADVKPAVTFASNTGSSVSRDIPVNFTSAAEKTMPAVVHIKSTQVWEERSAYFSPYFSDPFWDMFGEDFFHRGKPQQRSQVSTGSGVIVSPEGHIVTNNHVINNANEVEVSLYDNRTYKAKILGTDPSTDIALLKIDDEALPSVALANSDEVKVGEWVLAVGNPFNLTSTVTAGIVSAKARNINILKEKSAIESFIQTDAAVNPGNSGGALVNLDGELIGINTAIASPTGAYAGYAFSVPVNIVKKVVKDIIEFGVVQRGYLGAVIHDLNGKFSKENDLNITEGVYVQSLFEKGSAAEAGIKEGDVITAVQGVEVKSVPKLMEVIGRYRPGDEVKVTVNREGKAKELTVILRNDDGTTDLVSKDVTSILSKLGADFEPLTKQEAQKLNLEKGVKVTGLRNGKLKSTNMKEGFIITKVDGKPVGSIDELIKVFHNKNGGVMLEGIYPGYNGVYYYAFGL